MNFPGNIEEMLTNMYGDLMQLPPVEKRKTHTPSRLEFSRKRYCSDKIFSERPDWWRRAD